MDIELKNGQQGKEGEALQRLRLHLRELGRDPAYYTDEDLSAGYKELCEQFSNLGASAIKAADALQRLALARKMAGWII